MILVAKAWLATGRAYAAYQQAQEDKQQRLRETVPAFLEAARLAADRQRFDNALAQVNVALDYDPASAEAHLLKAQVLIVKNQFPAARTELNEYLGRNASDAEARQLLTLTGARQPEQVSNLLKIANVFEHQGAQSFADGLLTPHARSSFEARQKLLKLYAKRIDTAWPGLDRSTVDPQGIYMLNFADCKQVTRLDPLEGMPLTWLSLASCRGVRDLGPLKGMPLKWLSVAMCNEVRDLSPLAGMPLTQLDLSHCYLVGDLKPLSGMPLNWLSLMSCFPVEDLTPLRDARLTSLDLGSCKNVRDLSVLRGMPLDSLVLYNCTSLGDLSPLAGMRLSKLSLGGCTLLRDPASVNAFLVQWK